MQVCRPGCHAALRGASVDIDASTLATIETKSKANGIIKALRVNVDSVVTAGDVLVELDKDERLAQPRRAEANLLAARAAEDLANATIRVEPFRDQVFNGKVTQIAPIGVEKDNVTTFEVRVSIDNPGKELKANMTANAEIVLEAHANSLLLPAVTIVSVVVLLAYGDGRRCRCHPRTAARGGRERPWPGGRFLDDEDIRLHRRVAV